MIRTHCMKFSLQKYLLQPTGCLKRFKFCYLNRKHPTGLLPSGRGQVRGQRVWLHPLSSMLRYVMTHKPRE